jgi:hypothetical protein
MPKSGGDSRPVGRSGGFPFSDSEISRLIFCLSTGAETANSPTSITSHALELPTWLLTCLVHRRDWWLQSQGH